MPDLTDFSITPQGSSSVTVPRATIAGKLVDSQTGILLADFTGANAIQFPSVLATLSVAQRKDIIDLIATLIINQKAGFA